MKKLSLILPVIFFSVNVFAQKTVANPLANQDGVTMKNSLDSFSYALGQNLASYYKTQGIRDYNFDLIIKAIKDVLNNKKELPDNEVNKILGEYFSKARVNRVAINKAESENYLVANAKKAGVITTSTGLQYQVIKSSEGKKPGPLDTVLVHYKGSLLDGTIFDSSVDRGVPAKFLVSGVIKGWTEALLQMPKGSKWKLFVPSDLAYGQTGAGDKIGPNMALVFEIELLDILPFTPPKID
jgi:FKBP-type peptidyl-prolyl cis-trans isomerase FklB